MNPLKDKVLISMKVRRRAQSRKSELVHPSSPRRPIPHNNAAKVAFSLKGAEERPAELEKNRTCLRCCENKPVFKFSEEYVFPKEIGGTLILKDKVCSGCNGQYGDAADSDLVKHVVIKFRNRWCRVAKRQGLA